MTDPNRGSRAQLNRCKKHGRIYDLAKTPGCPDCLKEGATAKGGTAAPTEPGRGVATTARTRGLPPSVLLGAVAVVLAAIFGPGIYRGLSGGESVGPAAGQPPAAGQADSGAATATPAEATGATAALTPEARSTMALAERFAAELERIVAAGQDRLMGLPEIGVDVNPGTTQAQQAVQSYRALARSWHAQLDEASLQGPATWSAGASPRVQQVVGAVTSALNALRDAVPEGDIPPRGRRRISLDRAQRELARARQLLAAPAAR